MTDQNIQLLAIEAFLRRASEVDYPFMLKGSILTRQYLDDPKMRYVRDLDWMYMDRLYSVEEAGDLFSNWVTEVMEVKKNDRVKFLSFRENDFWREINYAMSDDFPTVNTDLSCFVGDIKNDDLGLDISFNHLFGEEAVPLMYQPLEGEPFLIPYTSPLPIQISGKLHQTITRPRLKDIYDLILLLKHPDFDKSVLKKTLRALRKECRADKVPIGRLKWFCSDLVYYYFLKKENPDSKKVDFRRFKSQCIFLKNFIYLNGFGIYDVRYFMPKELNPYSTLSELMLAFKNALNDAGFGSL